jgi:hypothetical protein
MRRETCSCLCDAEDSSGTALRLEASKAEELAAVLSEALCNEPHFRYVIPDDPTATPLSTRILRQCDSSQPIERRNLYDAALRWWRSVDRSRERLDPCEHDDDVACGSTEAFVSTW